MKLTPTQIDIVKQCSKDDTAYDTLIQLFKAVTNVLEEEALPNKPAEDAPAELKRLRESEIKYRQLFELESDAIFLIDNETGNILEVNTAACTLYGYHHEELLQLRNVDLSAQPDQTKQAMLRYASHIPVRYHRKRDGTVFPVEIAVSFLTWQGRPMHIAAIRDITQRQKNEQERERLIVDLEAYAYSVAHDLKNPISVILGYADLLLDALQAYAPEITMMIEKIHEHSQKNLRIIDSLLLLAKVRQLDEIPIATIEMYPLVAECLTRLQNEIKNADAKISVQAEFPRVQGYGEWVEEVWLNYVSNAIKYGGTPPILELGSDVQSDMVRFWVRDNGEGLTPSETKHLFAETRRLSKHQHLAGNGLGLPIVLRIVERLGGQVGVESELGQGSTFYFTLPAANNPSET